MAAKVDIQVNVLKSGAGNVSYQCGRYFGTVMFDEAGRYVDATMTTISGRGRGFVDGPEVLPPGVYKAARVAFAAVKS